MPFTVYHTDSLRLQIRIRDWMFMRGEPTVERFYFEGTVSLSSARFPILCVLSLWSRFHCCLWEISVAHMIHFVPRDCLCLWICCNIWGVHHKDLYTHYTPLSSLYGSVNTYPWTRCLFYFHSLSYILFFWVVFWGSHICVSHWNSRFLLFFFFFQILLYSRSPNKQRDDFKWGAEEMQSASLASCIKQERYLVDSQI